MGRVHGARRHARGGRGALVDDGARATAATTRSVLEPRDVTGVTGHVRRTLRGGRARATRARSSSGPAVTAHWAGSTTRRSTTSAPPDVGAAARARRARGRPRVDRGVRRGAPDVLIFRCVLASLYSQLGMRRASATELDRLGAEGFAGLEVGTEWHFGASLLAEACAHLGDVRHASRLYEALGPYGDSNVMAHPSSASGRRRAIWACWRRRCTLVGRRRGALRAALTMNAGWARGPGSPTPSTTMPPCCWFVTSRASASEREH